MNKILNLKFDVRTQIIVLLKKRLYWRFLHKMSIKLNNNPENNPPRGFFMIVTVKL